MLTSAPEPAAEILPSLSLLPHSVRVAAAGATIAAGTPPADVVLVDARRDLVQVRHLLRLLRASGFEVPVLVIVAEGGWAAVSADWGADDVILHTAGPGEVEARLRIAIGRAVPAASSEIKSGDLAIDEATYSARLRGRALDLTFKEFELLKFLAQYPGRVFSRAQLLQEVWGYDYFGGTRTVDVHVRRLRAKLGAEHEALIGTVRNVGYRFVPVKGEPDRLHDQHRGNGQSSQKEGTNAAGRPDQSSGDEISADQSGTSQSSTSQRSTSQRSTSQSSPAGSSPAGNQAVKKRPGQNIRDEDGRGGPGQARPAQVRTGHANAADQREGRPAHSDR
jgi:DNA-binding response OmpR family regulator